MSTRIFSFVVVVAVLIVSQAPAISDTNEPATPILPAPKTLAVLAQRMAATDRVISTNQGGAMAGHPGFSFSISADDVQRIVHAVSAASYVGSQEHPDFEWDWKLQFYTGTNFLAAICFAHDTFLADGVYRDDTGVLEEIYRDSSNREYVSRVYKNQDKEFAESKKAEAKEWLKSPLHTILGEDKKKVLKYVNDFMPPGHQRFSWPRSRRK